MPERLGPGASGVYRRDRVYPLGDAGSANSRGVVL